MFLNKKKSIVKITAIILCVILLSSSILSSCSSKYTDMMTLKHGRKTYKISVNVMSYFLSVYKTMFLYNNNTDMDSADFWAYSYSDPSYPSAKNLGDVMKEQIIQSVKRLLAAEALFEYHNLSLTKTQTNDIDKAIRDLVNSDKYGKSSAKLNDTLAKYSINMDILKEIRIIEKKYNVLREYLFTGKSAKENNFTDEDLKIAFLEAYSNYVRVKHILVMTTSDKKDEEGNAIELTEEELAAKKAYADDIYAQIKSGKAIEEFYSVTDDPGNNEKNNPDGYFFTYGEMVSEFETAAFEMKDGEVRIVKTDYGYHIMQKFPKEDLFDSFKTDSNTIAQAQNNRFIELLWPFIQEITMNNQEVKNIKFATIPTFFEDTDILPTE